MPTSWLTLRTLVSVLGALALGNNLAAQPRPSVSLIPGTVNAGGLNGTRFVSDLALTNPSPLPVTATLTLIPANGTSFAFATLNPGETIVYRNVLDSLWGAQGAGATQVIGTGPLLVRARTYNTAASGTYGVALPVYAYERLLAPGDTADSLWISQSADGASGYRTNIAVVFPDDGGGSASVSVYDADGNLAGTQLFNLSEPGFQQFSVASFAGAVPAGRAQIQVMGGSAAGYAVVVDNVTGDSSLFAFEDLPVSAQDVLVNGVARANGRNNTFFRTDARLYNQGSADATVSVAFHANQNANPTPLTRTFTVPAGKIRDVVDVLDSLLGLPVGSAGALRFTSADPVAILCRTSNVDPAGLKPGTFGAQQKPTPLLSFLMSADAGAVVTGIRQNATFRTNVGFAAGADGAGYTLTLKSASGAPVATAAGSLGPFGWTQPNVADLFPGTTVPEDATLLVQVGSGSVDVFDSSIDNASGDPVVTPIMALPADVPSAATIGPAGGSVRSSDGRLTLKVPAGALATPADVSFEAAASDAPNGIGPGYLLTVPSEVEGRAVLVLSYGASDIKGSGPEALSLAFKGGDRWYIAGGGSLDPAARTLALPVRSITPPGSPAAKAGRALLKANRITMAVLKAWRIVPDEVVVRTGTTTRFSAYYVGRPSSAFQFIDYFLAASDPQNVNVEWTAGRGTPEYGSINPTGITGTYNAPCKAPTANPFFVFYRIADNRIFVSGTRAFHGAIVYVLPKFWEGQVDLIENLCGRDGGGHYEWRAAKVNFSLDENLNVVDVVSSGRVAPQFSSPQPKCPGDPPAACSYVPGKGVTATLYAFSVEAQPLSASYGRPIFSLVCDFPLNPQTVTETCSNPTRVTELPGAGQSGRISIAVKGLHAPSFLTVDPILRGSPKESLTMTIKALPDNGCP
ncbi:MAG: hypothetical protein ABI584_00430 [Acidobacteriota bacterium]